MKYEYGTGEVILLQVLDYFHQKAVELEGAAYRANELKKIYDALNKDYVQKCAEYDALNKTYEAFNADFDKMCEERDAAVTEAVYLRENYKKLEEEYSELEKDYNDLRKTTKKLQAENDQHLREWSMQHVEKQAAERLATDMENNYQDLLKDYDNLYEENIKLKQALDERMTECDELKSEIRSLKTKISLPPEESEFLTYIAEIAKEEAGYCASPAQQEVWEENPYWR